MPYILQENQNSAWAQHGIDVESMKSPNPNGTIRTPLRNHRIPNHHTNGHNGIPAIMTMTNHTGTFPNHVSSRPGSRQSNRSQAGTIGGALNGVGMGNVRSPLSVKDSGMHSGINSPMNTTALSMVPEDEQPSPGSAEQEVIEVQILPQDDNWGDNTTAVTGNTSDVGGSMEDVAMKWNPLDVDAGLSFKCHRWGGFAITAALSLAGILSPIIMVTLPKAGLLHLSPEQLRCGAECDGALLSLVCKLVILAAGSWAVFLRRPRATTPRIYTLRALVLLILFVLIFAYWLFYCVHLIEETDEITLYAVVLFSVSLADSLLFVHCIAVLLMEIRQQQPQYVVKVIRSPDGESRTYSLGEMSIQRAAVVVLEKYYRDFSVYNPYLERIPLSKTKRSHHGSSFKFYDVDGMTSVEDPTGMSTSNGRRRESSHNERFYEESDYERRVRKRRARLLTAAEEAFTHIKRLHKDQGEGNPLGPEEAAQAVFPAISKPLQKYLRLTRQQPWHSMESILRHLSACVANDLSPKAFLERYLATYPMLQFEPEKRKIQTWALVCDTLVSRGVSDCLTFQLRQNQVTLFVTMTELPHINLTEDVVDSKRNKFVIRLNSETSV